MFIDRRFSFSKMAIIPQIYRFNAIPIKILEVFFFLNGNLQADFKIYRNIKDLKLLKQLFF